LWRWQPSLNSDEDNVGRAGRLIYDGFFMMRDDFGMFWLSNFFWLALLIPVITIPLAFAGLYTCAHGIVYSESLEWRSFFTGMKKHFGTSLRWAGANLLVLAVIFFYIWFFAVENNSTVRLSNLLVDIFLVIALVWVMFNMYTFPFMLIQEKPSYLTALRNSTVLFIKWPGQAIGVTLFNLVVIGLSLWLRFPWLLFGASLPALMACLCVKDVMERTSAAGLSKS
jgi:hypothetical protein